MRIVNREDFLKLPSGIIWSYYEPCVFGGLHLKLNSLEDNGKLWDFYHQDLIAPIDAHDSGEFFDLYCKAAAGAEVNLNFQIYSREGFFNHDQLFAVYDKEEMAELA